MSSVISDSNHPKQKWPFCSDPIFSSSISSLCFWYHYTHSCQSQKLKVHIKILLQYCLHLIWRIVAILSPNISCIWSSPLHFYSPSSGFRHLPQQPQSFSNRFIHLQWINSFYSVKRHFMIITQVPSSSRFGAYILEITISENNRWTNKISSAE